MNSKDKIKLPPATKRNPLVVPVKQRGVRRHKNKLREQRIRGTDDGMKGFE